MEAIFQKLIESDFSDIAGLRANASIPLSQSLTNEILGVVLQGDKTIQSCRVYIHEQNRVSVRLKMSLWPWPLDLNLKLDKSVDYASLSSPKMRMWLENHRVLGRLGSLFNALPQWARIYGSQIVIDLAFFPRTPEQKRLLNLVKSVEVRTEEGKAILDVKIEVD